MTKKTILPSCLFFFFTFTSYAQSCLSQCKAIEANMENVYFTKGLNGVVKATDSIRVMAADCDSCTFFLFQSLKWVAYAAQEFNDSSKQNEALKEMQVIFPKVIFKDANEKFSNYQDYTIRTANYYTEIGAFNKANQLYGHLVDTVSSLIIIDKESYILRNISLQGIGNVEYERANYHQAIKYYQYAIDDEIASAKLENREPVVSTIYCKLGKAHEKIGELGKAYEFYEICNTVYIDYIHKNPPAKVAVYASYFVPAIRSYADVAVSTDHYEEAFNLFLLLKSLEKPNNPDNVRTQISLAKYYHAINKKDSSLFYMNNALSILKTIPEQKELILDWNLQKATFLTADKKNSKALHVLDSIIDLAHKDKIHVDLFDNQIIAAKIQRINLLFTMDKKECLTAISFFQKEISKKLQQNIIFKDHIDRINDFYPILEKGLSLIYSDFPEEQSLALDLIECVKSIKLYKEKIFTTSQDYASDSLIIACKVLISQVNQLKLMISQGDSSMEKTNKLFLVEMELGELKKTLTKNTKENHQFQKKILLNLHQKKLNKFQVHFNFFSGNNHYYWIVVSSKDSKLFRAKKQPVDRISSQFIINLRDEMSSLDSIYMLGNEMYQILQLSDVLKRRQSIIISGDDNIAQLPFGVLVDDKGDYLIENYNIHYVPSALMYQTLKQKTLYDVDTIKTGIYVPDFKNKSNDDLEYARTESNQIATITNGDLYTLERATEEIFNNSCEQYDIIHLATHAVAINNNPSLSYIQFTENIPGEPEHLYYNEIKSLRLHTEMVCLSGCETGLGKNYTGEGMQSLARNFVASGARSVVSSFWSVYDEPTATIFTKYYTYLFEGQNKSAALANAKRNYLENHSGESRHPYYWSGIILTGSDNPLINTHSPNILGWLIAGGILLIVGWFLYNKRRAI